jgi:hypothetical protein
MLIGRSCEVGEIRYYGGLYPIEILPPSEYENCKRKYPKYKSLSLETMKSRTFPCLILRDFTTTQGLVFHAGEKALLKKSFCHRHSKNNLMERGHL